MAGQQQDADRAGGELGLDFGAPLIAARDLPIVPKVVGRGTAMFQRGRKIRLDLAQPANLPRLRLVRLVSVAVADKDDRRSRHATHRSCSDNLSESWPAQKAKSSRSENAWCPNLSGID